jgi:hypothetical protein
MEFAEILALIKKAIFLVGGACVVILLYYKYGKSKKSIGQDDSMKDTPKDDTPVVNVRRCEFVDDDSNQFLDRSNTIDIDRNEREWIEKEENPIDDFLGDRMPEDRRRQMIKDLDELGYHGSWKNTEENADPFED